jgi:putative MATE family efflux protein
MTGGSERTVARTTNTRGSLAGLLGGRWSGQLGRERADDHNDTHEAVEERKHGAGFGGAASLTDGPIGSTLWKLASPLALGFIINAVYSWTNMYFVSRLGESAIAALGFSDQLNFVLFTIGSGFCIGTGIVVARRVGEKRTRQASAVATQAFSFMALYSTAVAIALYFLLPIGLPLLGLKGEVLEYTRTYMSTLLIGFPGNLLMFQANASVRSTGNTVFPMTVLIITAVINLILDPVLILGAFGGPRLGVQGAAISTTIAEWTGALICIWALWTGRLNLRLFRPTLRFDRGIIAGIFRIGVPSSMQSLSVSASRVVIISIANMFGTAAVAAYTIGLRVDVLVFMPIFATGIAIETLVSQNIGARRFDRVKQFRLAALKYLGGLVAAMGVGIYLFAETIAGIFTDDRRVVELTADYLHVAVFGYFLFVIGQTATRSLSGAGHALRSMMIIAAILFLVQVPLAFVLSRLTPLGETGIFLAIAISYLILAIVGTWVVRGEKWMMKRV